jgi:hypothetical protein
VPGLWSAEKRNSLMRHRKQCQNSHEGGSSGATRRHLAIGMRPALALEVPWTDSAHPQATMKETALVQVQQSWFRVDHFSVLRTIW